MADQYDLPILCKGCVLIEEAFCAKSNTDNLKPETNTPEKPKSILRKIKDKLDDIADIKPGKKYTLKRLKNIST